MAYTAQHITSRTNKRMVPFDPDSADPVIVDLDPTSAAELLPLSDGFRRFCAGLMRTIGTGNVDAFQIIAAKDGDGTGATVVVEHAAPTWANAEGDTLWLECDADQVREALADATHIGVRVELATATDECTIFFERADPLFAHGGLTADYIQ